MGWNQNTEVYTSFDKNKRRRFTSYKYKKVFSDTNGILLLTKIVPDISVLLYHETWNLAPVCGLWPAIISGFLLRL